MKIEVVTKSESELIHLYTEAKEASKLFAEACQSIALQAETTPPVVRRYIAALASEKTSSVIVETEQLVMLFTALPTVTEQAA